MPLMGGFIPACLVVSIVLVTGGITAVAPASSAGASSSTLYVSTNGGTDRGHQTGHTSSPTIWPAQPLSRSCDRRGGAPEPRSDARADPSAPPVEQGSVGRLSVYPPGRGGPWMEAGNAAEEFPSSAERSQECSRGPALWPIATGSPMLRRTISRRIGSGRNQS